MHGMRLVEGRGNEYERGQPSEPDALNIVYILDSSQLPFYRAEQYHQFHNGGAGGAGQLEALLAAGVLPRQIRVACGWAGGHALA